MKLQIESRIERLPMREPFMLARGTVFEIEVLVVEVRDHEGHVGRGEAPGLPYMGETGTSMAEQIASVATQVEHDTTGEPLLKLLPAGGARNALDCALWDLRAKRERRRAWRLAGIAPWAPVRTAVTLGIGDDEDFRRRVLAHAHMPILKIKVNRDRHVDLVEIARELHPTARLIVDANQAWDRDLLDRLTPELHRLGVELVEQPVPRWGDEQLRGHRAPFALAADESCTDRHSLDRLQGLYSHVSIKLDKSGGLTEGLALASQARDLGFRLMVGNMGGTSLAMAPHFLIAQLCDYVDLDAPLLFTRDRESPLIYDGASIQPPETALWG
ncbi:dipeptide epimerase [Pelomonas sp. KK5]|uniref:dipeptide epimerase n=1 Tax=Pelomonas sp. KK5 TaxID=1855730 RepID=UPI0018E9BA31|nr:dipeptide epimerase [Pelomonas sp. KK5]